MQPALLSGWGFYAGNVNREAVPEAGGTRTAARPGPSLSFFLYLLIRVTPLMGRDTCAPVEGGAGAVLPKS